jgi:hypothetical protein
MLSSLIASLQPAGLVLVGAGLGSLVFSGPLAKFDMILESAGLLKVDTEHSRKWVEVAGATWGAVGIALLFASRFLG